MHNFAHSDYYEGKLQLRPYDEKLIEFVEKQFEKNDNIWISKKIVKKYGVDYFVSSNKFLRQLGKKLKNSFKGELIESKKLFSKSRLTSKEIYRVTVCFRLYKAL